MAHGKHAKPPEHRVMAATAAVVIAGAVATAPVAASAATMSQWDRTAQREAGGDWSINYSSDGLSVGGLQFQNPSWHDALDYLRAKGYKVSCWTQNLYQGMPRSSVPSKNRTILAGEALLDIQGSGAWANGNAAGSVSMFRGGPNPWGLPGTQVPAGVTCGSTPAPTPAPKPKPKPKPPVVHHRPTPQPPVVHGHVRTYVVKRGDCLSVIAERLELEGWRGLYEANRHVIGGDPDLISPGQVLVVP